MVLQIQYQTMSKLHNGNQVSIILVSDPVFTFILNIIANQKRDAQDDEEEENSIKFTCIPA
jgi:hypothetical protein